jgi:hypothetical protein
MDKIIICAMHNLNPDESEYMLSLSLGVEDSAEEDWASRLNGAHDIWMNLREILSLSSNKSYSITEIEKYALDEIRNIKDAPDWNFDEAFDNARNSRGVLTLDSVMAASAIIDRSFSRADVSDEDDSVGHELADWDGGIMGSHNTPLVRHLMQDIAEEQLILNPKWQRSDVWNSRKKRDLIESLLKGIPLPSLIIWKDSHGKQYVLDGKQRLTAITQFKQNLWRMGQMSGARVIMPENFTLAECSNKYYGSLPDGAKNKIQETKIPVIILEGLTNQELYDIFALYNTSGTKLNPAEIRNAAFHENLIHLMIFHLTGEADVFKDEIDDATRQEVFQVDFRSVCGSGKEPKRFAAMDMVERYLGYSRAPSLPGKEFKILSTSACIRAYYQSVAGDDKPTDTAKEVVDVWMNAKEFYAETECGPWHEDRNGTLRWNRLRTTCSMIVTRLIMASEIDKKSAIEVVSKLDNLLILPGKQQTNIIWAFQAKTVVMLLDLLSDYGADDAVRSKHEHFIAKMEEIDNLEYNW